MTGWHVHTESRAMQSTNAAESCQLDQNRNFNSLRKQNFTSHSKNSLDELLRTGQQCQHAPKNCAAPICFLRRSRKKSHNPQFDATSNCFECTADHHQPLDTERKERSGAVYGCTADHGQSLHAERQEYYGTANSAANRQTYNRLVGLEIATEISEALISDVSEQTNEVAFQLLTDPGIVVDEESDN